MAYVNDPSNTAPHFSRSRWRQIMPSLAAEGLTAERLARLAERQARANEALEGAARIALGEAVPIVDSGTSPSGLRFERQSLHEAAREIQIRALALALRLAHEHCPEDREELATGQGDSVSHISLERLEVFVERLNVASSSAKPFKASLAGMIITLDRHSGLTIRPEISRRRGRIHPLVTASLGKGASRA